MRKLPPLPQVLCLVLPLVALTFHICVMNQKWFSWITDENRCYYYWMGEAIAYSFWIFCGWFVSFVLNYCAQSLITYIITCVWINIWFVSVNNVLDEYNRVNTKDYDMEWTSFKLIIVAAIIQILYKILWRKTKT